VEEALVITDDDQPGYYNDVYAVYLPNHQTNDHFREILKEGGYSQYVVPDGNNPDEEEKYDENGNVIYWENPYICYQSIVHI
jgi:cystathionine beta-lyase/cystathionine gamma-synthase